MRKLLSRRARWALLAALLGGLWAPSAGALENFQAWGYGCNANGRCYALHNGAGIRLIFARDEADGREFASIVVPPTGQTGDPVTLRLGNNVLMQLNISGCSETFCEAVIGADKTATVKAYFREARDGVVAYLVNDKIVVSPFSLDGFGSAIERLEANP